MLYTKVKGRVKLHPPVTVHPESERPAWSFSFPEAILTYAPFFFFCLFFFNVAFIDCFRELEDQEVDSLLLITYF